MKITNLEKAQNYQLEPDTKIEVERTNPFFVEYGEQSVPLTIPATDHNRMILGFPDSMQTVKVKPQEVAIQDGEYFAQCRQIILAAQHKGSISTSFYINDGSLYSQLKNISLKDIFKDERIPMTHKAGNSDIQDCLDFCRSLRNDENEQYTIFPVLIDDDSGIATGLNFKMLNAYGKLTTFPERQHTVYKDGIYHVVTSPQMTFFHPDTNTAGADFYNAVQRTEYVNEVPVTLAPGYYISPFIRANYLLKRIFAYFGYQLQESFFNTEKPFDKMAVVNNVIDVMANGYIKIADLIPDIKCTEFIAVFRKKFCCEFTADDEKRTVRVVFLKDEMNAPPYANLTDSLTEEPIVNFKTEKDYKRVKLCCENKLNTDSQESYDNFREMLQACPAAYFRPEDGACYKIGFSGNYRVVTKIADTSQDYDTGEDMQCLEVNIPELMPEYRRLTFTTSEGGQNVSTELDTYMYIGEAVTINSKLIVAVEDGQTDKEKRNKSKTILAFSYLSEGKIEGTVSPYDLHSQLDIFTGPPRIFNYALYYNGEEGIFKKFYATLDTLLRNSLNEVKVKLLLSQSQKQNIPATQKVVIRGMPFFFKKMKFTLGGKNEPAQSEMYAISLEEKDISQAKSIFEIMPQMNTSYKWVGRIRQTEATSQQYHNSGNDKDRTFSTVYPPVPEQKFEGGKYFHMTSFTAKMTQTPTFFRHSKWKHTRTDVWLECVPIWAL